MKCDLQKGCRITHLLNGVQAMLPSMESAESTSRLHLTVLQVLRSSAELAEHCVIMDPGNNLSYAVPIQYSSLALLLANCFAPAVHIVHEDPIAFLSCFTAALSTAVREQYGPQTAWSLISEHVGEHDRTDIRVQNYVIASFYKAVPGVRYSMSGPVTAQKPLRLLPLWYWRQLLPKLNSRPTPMQQGVLQAASEILQHAGMVLPAVRASVLSPIYTHTVSVPSTLSFEEARAAKDVRKRVKAAVDKADITRKRLEAEIARLKRGSVSPPAMRSPVAFTIHTGLAVVNIDAEAHEAVQRLDAIHATVVNLSKRVFAGASLKPKSAMHKWMQSMGGTGEAVLRSVSHTFRQLARLRVVTQEAERKEFEGNPFGLGTLGRVLAAFAASANDPATMLEERSSAFRRMVALVLLGNSESEKSLRARIANVPLTDEVMYKTLAKATDMVGDKVMSRLSNSGLTPKTALERSKPAILVSLFMCAMTSSMHDYALWAVDDDTESVIHYTRLQQDYLMNQAHGFATLVDCALEHTVEAVERKTVQALGSLLQALTGGSASGSPESASNLCRVTEDLPSVVSVLADVQYCLNWIADTACVKKPFVVPFDESRVSNEPLPVLIKYMLQKHKHV